MRMKKVLILAALVCLALIFCAGGAALAETGADYYLVGSMTDWGMNEDYKLSASAEAEGEYCLASVSLEAGNEFKIISLNDYAWYPDGYDNNYEVSQTGTYDVYFRPNCDGSEDWYWNCIYVAESGSDGPQTGGDSGDTITVSFLDTLNWGTAYIYYWNCDGNGPNYPGDAMTVDGTADGYTRYKAAIPADTVGIFFHNNSGKQTQDITTGIADGAAWYAKNEQDNLSHYKAALYTGSTPATATPMPSPTVQPTILPGNNITVYFLDALNWGTPNIYYWNNGPAYPGSAMTADGTTDGYNRYKATIPADTVGIIFNGSGNQTTDITTGIADGATWYCTGEKSGNNFVAALYTGSGESGDTITVYLLEDVPESYYSVPYSIRYSTDGGSNWTYNVQMESDGTGSNSLPRYKASIPANTTNLVFQAVTNYDTFDAGSFSSGIVNGATWKMTYNTDNWSYVATALAAPAATPAPVTTVSPAGAGAITQIIPVPMPTDNASLDPEYAFQVSTNEGYELDTVVYQFDENDPQRLTVAYGVVNGIDAALWYLDQSAIPQSYNSLTVTANFSQAYTISVPDDGNISVMVGSSLEWRNYSKAGQTVTLEFDVTKVPEGYAADKLIVTPQVGEVIEVSMEQYSYDYYSGTFTMPAAPVTVSYKPFIYGLSAIITGSGGVTFTVNGDPVTQAATDAIVTLTVTPDDGYALESLTYIPAGGNPTDIAMTLGNDGKYTGTFTMPAAVVTVDAAFIKSIAGLNIELDEEPVYDDETQVFAYTGKAVEPEVSVTRWVQTDNGWEEVALVQGTDYTVTYTNNTGSPDAVTDAAVTLTGIGEYGETKTIPFRISPFNLADCKATVPNPTYNDGYFIGYFYDGSWNDNHGGIVVKDNAGNTLDYYHYDEASGKMVGDYIYAGTESLDYPDKYTDDLCTHVGESCRVTLKACGDWAGTLTVDIVISPPAAEGVGWSFEAGVLSITGSGAMTPQNTFSAYPWYQYSSCITDIVISEGITSVPKAAFGGSSNVNPYTNVKTVTLPTTLTDIGECAFAYCSLETINLDYVETIESQAFNQCGNLSIVVPAMAKHTDDIADTVKSIDEFAFEACGKVTFAIVIGDTENGTVTATVNNSAVEAAAVNAAVTLIIAPAEGCELESVTYTPVGDNEEEINADAETGAYTFTMPRKPVIVNAVFTVLLPDFGIPDFTLPSDLKTIEASAFEGVEEMTVVDAHACTFIGKDAFKDCTELKQIKLPKDCAIDPDAFSGCGTVYVFAPAGGNTEAYCGNHGNLIFVEENEDVPLESFEGGSGPVYVLPKK